MEERMISPEPTVRRPSADLSERELERIKAFIQGAVYSYCKNCKGESFSASTLFGGDNYYWQGTPLEVVYERHIEDDDPVNRVFSVPGRIVTFSTKIGVLGHWKRDLAI
jgi:hypothetical protein